MSITRLLLLALALGLAAPCTPVMGANDKTQAEEAEPELVGFELGSYVLKDYQPLQDQSTRLIFTAHASVLKDDADAFAKQIESRRFRVRDQVIIAARLAAPEELQDPDLSLLRRRILLRLKHSLPELAIEQVYLSEFQLYNE